MPGQTINLLIIIFIVIVVLIVLAVAATLLGQPKSTLTTLPTTAAATTVPTTTITQNISANASQSGQIIISQQQAASLIGTGGIYNWTSTTDPGQISAFEEYYEPGFTGLWNVTEIWGAWYNQTNSSILQIVLYVQPMPGYTPQGLYTEFLNYTNSTIVTLNGTSNGMTYSYLISSNSTAAGSSLIGWKGSYVTQVLALGKNVSSTELANITGSELP